MRRQTVGLFVLLLAANLTAWGWALAAFHGHPLLLGTALLAYGFGLRHAVDADHIAAIDNVTRKLLQEGQRPIAAGFFFALGHSTVVVVAATAIAVGASTLQQRFPSVAAAGGTIGASVSVLFLFAIAIANLTVLRGVYGLLRRVRRGCLYRGDEIGTVLARRSLLGRLFRGVFGLVSRSWHMYPLGLLFGLGFDTATEIGILGISAAEAAKGLSLWSILVFPALFTAGMALVDAADGVLMLKAYSWALVDPIRKLHYNLAITGLSVAVALIIGTIEAISLVVEKLGLVGGVWDAVGAVAGGLGVFGYAIVAVFVASWLVSLLVYRWRSVEKLSAPARSGS